MSSLPLIEHRLAGVACLAEIAAMALVDVRSWRRTRPLRRGWRSLDAAPTTRGPVRSSRTTFLAGAAGLSALVFGLTTPHGLGWGSQSLVAAGTFVAITGLAGRVRILEADSGGLMIRYAARAPAFLSWAECRELRPPRTPLGGWHFFGTGRSRSLMPSDLLHREWVLEEIIDSAGLSFAGRNWTRGPPRQGG
jgi:hypothetical protein